MPWHDQTPWAAKKADHTKTIDGVASVVERFRSGQVSFSKAKREIEDLLEDTTRIVHVGRGHNPEVQS